MEDFVDYNFLFKSHIHISHKFSHDTIEFLHNSSFTTKSGQNPTSIDILWVSTSGCQYWQIPGRISQEMTNFVKSRLFHLVLKNFGHNSKTNKVGK